MPLGIYKTYDKMKDSGVEWIGMIPKGWEIKRIKSLALSPVSLFLDGDWINSPDISDSGIRYFTTGNVGQGFFKEQGNGYITAETFDRLGCTMVHAGDLIISRLNEPIGRACIIPAHYDDCIVAVDNVILRPDAVYCKKFLMYCMSSDRYAEYTALLARGTTMHRISRTQLGNIPLPIPPLSEQENIAFYLDEKCAVIDDIITEAKASIEEYKAWKASVIFEAVTKGLDPNAEMKDSGVEWIGKIPKDWDVVPLKRYYDYSNGAAVRVGPFGSALTSSDITTEEGIIVYNQRTVLDNNFETNATFVTPAKAEELTSFGVFPDDILITTRGSIGKIVIVPKNAPYGILHPCIIRFRVDEGKMDKRLLKYIFNNTTLIQQQILYHSNSTTIDVLYSYTLKELVLPLIPKHEQNEIVLYLNKKCSAIDGIITEKEALIAELETYKKSLIFETVTGKRRVC